MLADPDTLLTALYVELTDRVIIGLGLKRRGPGRPPDVTAAELVCIAVAQVLLRCDDERHWLRAAPRHIGHLAQTVIGGARRTCRCKRGCPPSSLAGNTNCHQASTPAIRWPAVPGPVGEVPHEGSVSRCVTTSAGVPGTVPRQ